MTDFIPTITPFLHSTKRFFAYWIVFIFILPLIGVIIAAIDYSTALIWTNVETGNTIVNSAFGVRWHDTPEMFGIYAFTGFAVALIGYPLFRLIIGSFRVICK